MDASEIDKLFAEAEQHVVDHDCSAHPYKYAKRLAEIVEERKPTDVLEIGTGAGFTGLVIAKSNPDSKIITLEKDPEHVEYAQNFFVERGVANQIKVLQVIAEQYLPTLQQKFDLIFFDGYGIHYEFLAQYHRLIKDDGVVVIANNHLTTRTSDQFFADLKNPSMWQILEQFGDTTVAQKSLVQ